MSKEHILKTIELIRFSFEGADSVYQLGSCYRFSKLLCHLYSSLNPVSLHNMEHCITKITGCYYDITGEIPEHQVIEDNYLIMEDWQFDVNSADCLFSMYSGNDLDRAFRYRDDVDRRVWIMRPEEFGANDCYAKEPCEIDEG